MASYVTQLRPDKQYKSQIPTETIAFALQSRQKRYDHEFAKLENYYANLSSIDLAKVEDQEYFSNNLKAVKQKVDAMGTGDLSVTGAGEVMAYIGQAADDAVVNGYINTKKYRALQSEWEQLRKENPELYNEDNYNYSMYNGLKWLNDGKVGSTISEYSDNLTGVKGLGEVNPYINIVEEANKRIKDIVPEAYVEMNKSGEFEFFKAKGERITDDTIKTRLTATLLNDPQIQKQMEINAWSRYKGISDEDFVSYYKQNKQSLVKLRQDKIKEWELQRLSANDEEKAILDNNIKIFKDQINEIKTSVLDVEDEKIVEKRRTLHNIMYQQDFLEEMSTAYAYDMVKDMGFEVSQEGLARWKQQKDYEKEMRGYNREDNKRINEIKLELSETENLNKRNVLFDELGSYYGVDRSTMEFAYTMDNIDFQNGTINALEDKTTSEQFSIITSEIQQEASDLRDEKINFAREFLDDATLEALGGDEENIVKHVDNLYKLKDADADRALQLIKQEEIRSDVKDKTQLLTNLNTAEIQKNKDIYLYKLANAGFTTKYDTTLGRLKQVDYTEEGALTATSIYFSTNEYGSPKKDESGYIIVKKPTEFLNMNTATTTDITNEVKAKTEEDLATWIAMQEYKKVQSDFVKQYVDQYGAPMVSSTEVPVSANNTASLVMAYKAITSSSDEALKNRIGSVEKLKEVVEGKDAKYKDGDPINPEPVTIQALPDGFYLKIGGKRYILDPDREEKESLNRMFNEENIIASNQKAWAESKKVQDLNLLNKSKIGRVEIPTVYSIPFKVENEDGKIEDINLNIYYKAMKKVSGGEGIPIYKILIKYGNNVLVERPEIFEDRIEAETYYNNNKEYLKDIAENELSKI